MGQVWRAVDEVLEREVERLRRETRTAALVSHPNVVAVYDFGTHDDGLFLVMELVCGHSLARQLADYGVMDPESAMRIASQAAAGLAAAHREGVVHRDVKPGQPVARRRRHGQDRRLRYRPVGDRCRHGYHGYGRDRGDQPRDLRPELTAGFEAFLLSMLAKDPRDRPTARDVAEWTPTATQDVVPPAARHRRVVLSGAAAAATTAAMALGMLFLPGGNEATPSTADPSPPPGTPSRVQTSTLAKPTVRPTTPPTAPTKTTTELTGNERTTRAGNTEDHPPKARAKGRDKDAGKNGPKDGPKEEDSEDSGDGVR